MQPRGEYELLARDVKRNIGKELLQALRDAKTGKQSVKYKVQRPRAH